MGNHRHNPLAHNNIAPVSRPQVRDKFGRVLAPGDGLLLVNGLPPKYILADVRPNLHPGAPPNMVIVTIVSQVTFPAQADSVLRDVVRIQTAEETGWVSPEEMARQAAEAEAAGTATDGSPAPEKQSIISLTDMVAKKGD